MLYKNVGTIFCRFVTIQAFDRRTDGYLAHGYTVRCITCSRTVKTKFIKDGFRRRCCTSKTAKIIIWLDL